MPPDRSQLAIVARELSALAAEIEDVGAGLCADPAVIVAHMTLLQAIDLIGQRQRALADLLRAADFGDAVAACTLSHTAGLFVDQHA